MSIISFLTNTLQPNTVDQKNNKRSQTNNVYWFESSLMFFTNGTPAKEHLHQPRHAEHLKWHGDPGIK